MKRSLFFLYGLTSYIIFLGVFIYSIGFVGNFFVPISLDSEATAPFWDALLINTLILGVFAIQHSIMARPGFKRMWTKIVPVPLERSTYVMFSNVCMILFFMYWEPMGGVIWNVQDPTAVSVLYGLFGFGWLLVLLSTFFIDHFDLFGMRQVWLYARGKAYTDLKFEKPYMYKLVRHPLYLGWLFAFWAIPTMTVAHLVFALATTGYILIAIKLEEKDLGDFHGDDYHNYQNEVPMLIPFSKRKKEHSEVIG